MLQLWNFFDVWKFHGSLQQFFQPPELSYKESSCLKDHATVNIWFWVICLNKLNKFYFFDFISLILALPVSTMDSARNILVSLFQQSVKVIPGMSQRKRQMLNSSHLWFNQHSMWSTDEADHRHQKIRPTSIPASLVLITTPGSSEMVCCAIILLKMLGFIDEP